MIAVVSRTVHVQVRAPMHHAHLAQKCLGVVKHHGPAAAVGTPRVVGEVTGVGRGVEQVASRVDAARLAPPANTRTSHTQIMNSMAIECYT